MSTAEVILLLGVAGLWTGLLIVVAAAFRMQRSLVRLEDTVDRLQRDVSTLVPRVGLALEEVERAAAEISKTSASARVLLDSTARHGFAPAALGALKYLPAAVSVARLVIPLFSRRRR
jgi:HAMP domain-containing protein